jgi:RNA polymerase sigma factor (sigma-70 family)
MGIRWSAIQEQAVAESILTAESNTVGILRSFDPGDVPRVFEILDAPHRAERTRAPSVERMRNAVACLWELSTISRSLRSRARKAMAFDHQAESLRWQLAMSGQRIAYGESKKLGGPIPPEDLAQEGFLGLYKAAVRFEPSKGLRFSTYARWWVRAQMTRAIDNTGMTVRMPSASIEQRRNIGKLVRRWQQEGLEYTNTDIASEMGMDVDRVGLLLNSSDPPTSLSEPCGGGEPGWRDRSLIETLVDASAPDLDEDLNLDRASRWASWALAQLPDRHRRILRRLYGLDGKPRTLTEVGGMEEIPITKERTRQIKEEALELLRDQIWGNRDNTPPLSSALAPEEHRVLDLVWAGHRKTRRIARAIRGGDPTRGDIESVRVTLRELRIRGEITLVRGGALTEYGIPGETMGRKR